MIEERPLSKGKYVLLGISIFPNSGSNIPALLESNTELGHTLNTMLANNEWMNSPEIVPHFCDNFLHAGVCCCWLIFATFIGETQHSQVTKCIGIAVTAAVSEPLICAPARKKVTCLMPPLSCLRYWTNEYLWGFTWDIGRTHCSGLEQRLILFVFLAPTMARSRGWRRV